MPLHINEISIRTEIGTDDPTAPTHSEAEISALKAELLAECQKAIDSHAQSISARTGIPVKTNVEMR